MATKKILLATADLQTVVDVSQALSDAWETVHVASEAEAAAQLQAGAFDALLVDFNLGSPDASELLNHAAKKCPDITRFLFACEADLALVAAKVEGEPEILPKPLELDSLKRRIENGLDDANAEDSGTATGFDTATLIPAIYSEVIEALDSPEATSQQVGEIIASDDALTQELLMLTRSTYLGVPRNILEPVDAVEALGFETVRALVMARRFLAEHSHVRPGYLSLERIWQHSTKVALIARDLVLFETKNRALASQALAAGLVHDLGKVVLATNFDDLYGRVHSLARKQPVALWEVEKEMFGAGHGEIGACLLGMWNLSPAVVDAAAFHHEPTPGESNQLTPLAAVHIANVLEHQLRPTDEFRVLPVVNSPFVNQLGLLQRMPIWRATFGKQLSQPETVAAIAADHDSTAPESDATSISANELQAPTSETWTSTAAPVGKGTGGTVRPGQWIYASVVAGILLLLGFFARMAIDTEVPVHVQARAFPSADEFVIEPPAPAVETLVATEPAAEAAPAPEPAPEPEVVIEPAPTPEVTPIAVPEVTPVTEVVQAVPVAIDASASRPAVAPEPAVVVEQPVEPPVAAAPSFRLNGIFYSASSPSAIVNGQTVLIGDKVDGATVIRISRSEVTLDLNGERKSLMVPGAK